MICDEGFDTVACGTAADGHVMGVRDVLNTIVEDGQPTELAGVMIDITEREQVEDTLRESEQNFRFMFAHNPLSMWVYDRDTHAFLDVNDAELVNLATHAKNFFR